MQREEYIARFQSECYLPAASAAMNRFMASYADQSEQIHKTVVGQFDAFSRCIVRLQERKLMDSVHSIAISFPYSSLLCGNPCMMFELYPDFPFFAPHQLQEVFSAPWVFPECQQGPPLSYGSPRTSRLSCDYWKFGDSASCSGWYLCKILK